MEKVLWKRNETRNDIIYYDSIINLNTKTRCIIILTIEKVVREPAVVGKLLFLKLLWKPRADAIFRSIKGINTPTRDTILSKYLWLHAEKGSSLKGKNLLRGGENSFLLELTCFQKGTLE